MNNTVLKDGEFKITADQLMQLENGFTLPKLKEWFPEAFGINPEIGKWYKSSSNDLYCVISVEDGIVKAYGFQNHKWLYGGTFGISYFYGDVEATEQEVFEALKKEAVKRGISFGKNLRFVECDNLMIDGKMGEGGLKIFKNGVFIETKTRKQAEQALNCKIID